MSSVQLSWCTPHLSSVYLGRSIRCGRLVAGDRSRRGVLKVKRRFVHKLRLPHGLARSLCRGDVVNVYAYRSRVTPPCRDVGVSRPPIRPTEHAGPRATLGADCWRPWPPLIKRPSWWGWPGIKPRYSKRAARLSAALDSHTQSPAEGRLWWCPSGR